MSEENKEIEPQEETVEVQGEQEEVDTEEEEEVEEGDRLLKANRKIEALKNKLKDKEVDVEKIKAEAKEEGKRELLIDRVTKQVGETKREKVSSYFQKGLSEDEVLTLLGTNKGVSEAKQEIEVDTDQREGGEIGNVITLKQYESLDLAEFKKVRAKIKSGEMKLIRN